VAGFDQGAGTTVYPCLFSLGLLKNLQWPLFILFPSFLLEKSRGLFLLSSVFLLVDQGSGCYPIVEKSSSVGVSSFSSSFNQVVFFLLSSSKSAFFFPR